MLQKLTRDDVFVLAAFTTWLAIFVMTVFLLVQTGFGLDSFNSILRDKETSETFLFITLILVVLSVVAGLSMTDPESGNSTVLFGVGLAMFNTSWLSMAYAHFMAAHISPSMLFVLMVAPFYIVWLAQQTSGVAWLVLHAVPTAGVAWLMRGDPFVAVASGFFVAALSLVYALSIRRVESSAVDKWRRALGLILFVQGVALATVFVKIVQSLKSGKDEEQSAAKTAAEIAAIAALTPIAERVAFGQPAVALSYHALLYIPIFFSVGTLAPDKFGGVLMVTVLSGLMLFAVLSPKKIWGLAGYVLFIQVGVGVIFSIF